MAKTNIHDVIKNTKKIYMSDSSLDTLMDFERVLDEVDLYAFDNWKSGELVEGPIYEKYFVSCTFMWPYKKMPDPRGGERLLDYDCDVKYRKASLEYPVKPKGYDDFEPGDRMPKLQEVPIWLVEIVVPKELMRNVRQGAIDIEGELLDASDIEQSYEEGLDDKMYQDQDNNNDMASLSDDAEAVGGVAQQQGGV